MALLYASKELENIQTANFDQKIGVQIIQNALKVYFCAMFKVMNIDYSNLLLLFCLSSSLESHILVLVLSHAYNAHQLD